MRKAYDTFLQSEVSAELAAKSSSLEPYRYECAHCGEEVRLTAIDSKSMVSHFRHRNGNNDVECEKYLGQYETINIDSSSRKSRNERAEFYFDNTTKMFYLGLRFSNDEIIAYEQQESAFELRLSYHERAFITLRINKKNFAPDTPRIIPIDKFSYNYFLSNTLNDMKRKYELFKKNGNSIPTFFKIQGNDSDYKAKLVRSSILYTNTSYFVALQSLYSSTLDFRLPKDIEVQHTFRFETMGRKFLGKVLTIKAKNFEIDSLVESWGYQLETSDTLTLLWPPAPLLNEVSMITSNYAFLFSSFELEAHGNINVHSEDIKKITSGVSRVSVDPKIKIYRKNAEIIIDKARQSTVSFEVISFEEKHESIYTVSDDRIHFLFNRSGAILMSNGQSVTLAPGNVIKRYYFGYLVGLISYMPHQNNLTCKQLLDDMLLYYKRTEPLYTDIFDSLELSDVAFQYIERCKESGAINSAAKCFIKEGLL